MSARPQLSVVVLSWNTKDLLEACLKALQDHADGLHMEIVVIDNASEDGSPDLVAERFPDVVLQRNEANQGYAIGVNQGLARATGEKICLLGSDTRVREGTLRTLVETLDAHAEIGAVAPPLLNDDESVQTACSRFPRLTTLLWWDTPLQHWFANGPELRRYLMKDWDHRGTRDVDQPPGTCIMVRREVYERVGPMDEELWLFFNDVDWCKRIHEAGWRIRYVDCSGVFHKQSSSVSRFGSFAEMWHRNRLAYYRKHFGWRGATMTKTVILYVALRECVRVKRQMKWGPEYRSICRQLLGGAWALVRGRS